MKSNWEKKAESKVENHGEESHAFKGRKSSQEKKMGRAQAKAQYSPFRLERSKNRLAEQKPYKPFSLAKRTATAAGTSIKQSCRWRCRRREIRVVCLIMM